MNTLEKAVLTALVCHIEGFSNSGIPIYNSKYPDTASRKTRRRRRKKKTQAKAKHYVFHANAIKVSFVILVLSFFYNSEA